MKTNRFLAAALGLGFLLPLAPAIASDHADPQEVLNPFKSMQDDPAANLTDLHSFLADGKRRPIVEDITIDNADARKADVEARIKQDAKQLIISFCVRRRLLPNQIRNLPKEDISKYTFRLHLDTNPILHHYNPADTQGQINDLDEAIKKQITRRDQAHKDNPPMGDITSEPELVEQRKLNALLMQRGNIYGQRRQDELMEGLYGGIIDRPESIAEDALLDFHLLLKEDADTLSNSEVVVVEPSIQGIPGEINIVTAERKTIKGAKILVEKHDFEDGKINVQGGIFDDPFIFPRFYRVNVIGVVVSIPLDSIRQPNGDPVRGKPILLWATTHKPDGSVSDHVGRSLRTQLPRFGYLNYLHPSRHNAEILRVHGEPTLIENGLTTFIAPLEAHRHYDTAPDVMIYDLAMGAKFPNGRWLGDDVSKTLADNGETLLLELACSESRQTPRATTNDKPFYSTFPYLASRWSECQIAEHLAPGSNFGDLNLGNYTVNPEDAKIAGTFTALKGKRVPDAQDLGAIASPDFNPVIWRSIWTGVSIFFWLVLIAAVWGVRSAWTKFLVLVYGLFVCCYLNGCELGWLRLLAAAIIVLLGLVALFAVSKWLQRCVVVLAVTALLCLLWPAWWLVVKLWFLIALAVVVGGYLFTLTDHRGRLAALVLGALAFWGCWHWTYVPPMTPAAPVVTWCTPRPAPPSNPLLPVPTDTPNDRFMRLIASNLLIVGLGLFALYAWGVRRGIKRAAEEKVVELGDQRETTADRQYTGTSFQNVKGLLFSDPHKLPLPVARVTAADLARGMLSLSTRFLFKDAAERTLASHADLRGVEHITWDADGKPTIQDGKPYGVRRIIHPNGICLTGTWSIRDDIDTGYTGYFARGSKGLIVTRYSTGLEVRRGEKRTLSMVGKLYPTLVENEVHRTASFITQDDLGAAVPEGIHDVNLCNAPKITVSQRFPDLASLFLIGFTFFRVDMRNTVRQLYEIAELGKPEDVPTKCPQFMRLRVCSPKMGGGDDTADFRDEILAHVYKHGTQERLDDQARLKFSIEVSDTGEVTGLLDKKLEGAVWREIGTIIIDDAVASFSGDNVIHFHHPKWRNDVNVDKPSGESPQAKLVNRIGTIYGNILRFIFGRRRTP